MCVYCKFENKKLLEKTQCYIKTERERERERERASHFLTWAATFLDVVTNCTIE